MKMLSKVNSVLQSTEDMVVGLAALFVGVPGTDRDGRRALFLTCGD